MHIRTKHIAPLLLTAVRLSDYAIGIFAEYPSRKSIKKAIKRGEVLVNNMPANTGTWVNTNDEICLIDLALPPNTIYELKFPVLYEDAYLAVIQKPAGVVTSGNQFKTIENALPYNLTLSDEIDALKSPRVVHRLDAPTSGLLLVAKTTSARAHLGLQFENKEIHKQYQAICAGKLIEKGTITLPLEGKAAHTDYTPLEIFPSLQSEWLTLVDLFPKTGRTHQLRQHLAHIGAPILGDALYGKAGKILKHKGLFLTAVGLSFKHPQTERLLHFKLHLATKFKARIILEKRRWAKFNTTLA